MKVYYSFERRDKDYLLLEKTKRKRSRSFLKNFITSIYYNFGSSDSSSVVYISTPDSCLLIKTDGNVLFTVPSSYCVLGTQIICSSQGYLVPNQGSMTDPSYYDIASNFGIKLGTGTSALDPAQYSLDSIINHGTAVGELEHLGGGVENFVTGASSCSFDIIFLFRNGSGSGGSITVNEIGLAYRSFYFSQYYSDHKNYNPIYIIRDLVSPGQVVGVDEYLRVKYTIEVTA